MSVGKDILEIQANENKKDIPVRVLPDFDGSGSYASVIAQCLFQSSAFKDILITSGKKSTFENLFKAYTCNGNCTTLELRKFVGD